MTVTRGADGKPRCEVSFGFGDAVVKTKVTYLAIDGAKVHVKYEFDLQGNKLESTVTGELTGDTLSGKYSTKVVADGAAVDEGEWKAKRK